MKRSKGLGRTSPRARAILIVILSLCFCMLAGCGKRLQRLESNQIVMEEKVDASNKRIEIMTYKMEEAQAQLQAAIDEVKQGNELALAEAVATRYEQRKLRESSDSNGDIIRAGVDQIQEKQQALGLSLDQVDSRTHGMGADIAALAGDQQSLRERISGDHEKVVTEIGAVKENQVKTHGMSARVLAEAQAIGSGVADIQRDQAALSRTVKGNDQELKAQIAGVAQQQNEMDETLSDTHAVALIIANKVDQVQDKQTNLHALSQTHADQLNSGIALVQTLQQEQKGLSERVRTQADKINGDVAELQRKQVGLLSGVQRNQATAQGIAADVRKVQGQLDNGMTQVEALQEGQENLGQLVRTRTDKIEDDFTELQRQQIGLSTGIQQNQATAQAIAADVRKVQGQLNSGMTQVEALQAGQEDLGQLIRTRADEIEGGFSELQRQQTGLSTGIQQNQATAQAIAADVKKVQGQLDTGMTQVEAVGEQQIALQELLKARTGQINESVAQLQQNQASLLAEVQENQEFARKIVAGLKKLQEQQEALRELIQSETATLTSLLTQIDEQQHQVAVELQSNSRIVNGIKGDLTQGQVKQVESRLQAVDVRLASLDSTVSKLESRLALLSTAMQAYQQERADVDKALTDGLASQAQALEQIKVNQLLLSRRLNQTREDARIHNERFQGTLEQLRKASIKPRIEPKAPTLPPEDVESDE